MSDGPQNKPQGMTFRSFMKQRYLLWSFVRRDLKQRYGASLMGFFWSVINPLLLILVYTIVFGYFLKVNVGGSAGPKNYGIFLFSGMLPWLAFSEAIIKSSTVILENKDLVKQVHFSTILLPTQVVISSFLHEMIALVIFVILLWIVHTPPTPLLFGIVLFFPLQLLFTLGISLIVSSFAVYYKDVRELVVAIMSLWFFASPIIYPVGVVPEWMVPYFRLNPVAPLINVYRTVLLGDVMPDIWGFMYFAGCSVLLFGIGVKVFVKFSKDFPDIL